MDWGKGKGKEGPGGRQGRPPGLDFERELLEREAESQLRLGGEIDPLAGEDRPRLESPVRDVGELANGRSHRPGSQNTELLVVGQAGTNGIVGNPRQ